ncbi:uncharacterized protein LOC125260447 isoform X2 [Megalobrama amblycephala]|uniref:uncharacterized protein LOC125260447 isoform X2 n=1 Tax=Megalobrama amblycephala TaxID=75352 RepID=UPI002013CF02|nr:uncharacterized protein LOC125260447 isoform X2 [Megalobrama amblycephala]
MATADQLLELIFCWIEEREHFADNLRKLAEELESLRKKCNVGECVSSSFTVLGAASMIGAGVATVFTFGAAAPLMSLAATFTNTGCVVYQGTELIEDFLSCSIMKKLQDIEKKSNKIAREIQQMLKPEKEVASLSAEADELEHHIMAEILRAIARQSGVNVQIINDSVISDILNHMLQEFPLEKISDVHSRRAGRGSSSARVGRRSEGHFARQSGLYVQINNDSISHTPQEFLREKISDVHSRRAGRGSSSARVGRRSEGHSGDWKGTVPSFFIPSQIKETCLENIKIPINPWVISTVGILTPVLIIIGHDKKRITKLRDTVAGGLCLMEYALPEMIDNWTKMIEGNHVTEASQSLRDTADRIQNATQTMKEQIKKTKKMLQVIEQKQQESQETEQEVQESQETEQEVQESQETEQDEQESQETEQEVQESQETEQEVQESQETEQEVQESQETEQEVQESQETEQEVQESQETEQDEQESQETEQDEQESQETEQEEWKRKKRKKTDQEEQESQETEQKEWKWKKIYLIYLLLLCLFPTVYPPAVSVGLLNAHSILSIKNMKEKRLSINNLITEHNLDVFLMTETWLKNETADVALSEASPINFTFHHECRNTGKRGGGVAIQYSEELNSSRICLNSTTIFEYVAATLRHEEWDEDVVFITVYNPPTNPPPFKDFLEELKRLLNETNHCAIVAGDFNFNVKNNNSSKKPSEDQIEKFKKAYNTYGFKQHVDEPTHKKGNTLDLVFSRNVDVFNIRINRDKYKNLNKNISDHSTIYFDIRPLPKSKNATTKANPFKKEE